eukprot:3298461-Pyramimonas_sp.AAC.1
MPRTATLDALAAAATVPLHRCCSAQCTPEWDLWGRGQQMGVSRWVRPPLSPPCTIHTFFVYLIAAFPSYNADCVSEATPTEKSGRHSLAITVDPIW